MNLAIITWLNKTWMFISGWGMDVGILTDNLNFNFLSVSFLTETVHSGSTGYYSEWNKLTAYVLQRNVFTKAHPRHVNSIFVIIAELTFALYPFVTYIRIFCVFLLNGDFLVLFALVTCFFFVFFFFIMNRFFQFMLSSILGFCVFVFFWLFQYRLVSSSL